MRFVRISQLKSNVSVYMINVLVLVIDTCEICGPHRCVREETVFWDVTPCGLVNVFITRLDKWL